MAAGRRIREICGCDMRNRVLRVKGVHRIRGVNPRDAEIMKELARSCLHWE